MKKIIDLSKYNTVTDWNKVKNNVDGIIIRVGYRGYTSGTIVLDAKALQHIHACVENNIPFGLYFMSQAINQKEAREEAAFTVSYATQYRATLGLYIDSEDGDGTPRVVRADGLSKDARTAVVMAFCEAIEAAGYDAGIYASEDWFKTKLNYDKLKKYRIWASKWGANTGSKVTSINLQKCDMHQYTSRGSIPGISGNADLSEAYFDVETKPQEPHVQKNYCPGVAYFVHATNLNVRSKPDMSGKVYYQLSNRAVLNKMTTKDKDGRIWMNVSGTDREEWACADTGSKAYIY